MFLLIFILIFQTLNTQETNNQTKPENLENITRVEDESHILSKGDFKEIKKIVDKNFHLLLIKISSGEEYMGKKLAFFETNSLNYFNNKCKKYKDMCDYGFSINIFIKQKLLIIEIGKESKILLDDSYRQRMTDSIRDELNKENWSNAIKKILIFINYRLSGGKITPFPKTSDYPQIYILTVMVPLFAGLIIILTILFYFGSTKFIFCSEVKQFFDGIILRLNELENLKNIPENEEKKIEIKNQECLFCWQPSLGKNEYFMHCGHRYHEKCLLQWRLYQYACCPCSYECYDDTEPEDACLSRDVYLNIEDIKILLALCLDAFRKENIYDYFIENEAECKAVHLGDLIWINQKKFENYSSYRIFYKLYKVIKLMVFFVTFYPEFLKSKKVKLIERLIKMKNKGFFGG